MLKQPQPTCQGSLPEEQLESLLLESLLGFLAGSLYLYYDLCDMR